MPPVNPRIPLTTDRVLRAAMELADAEGLAAVTMRRVGEELGVEAMSLYNHVANKAEVLEGIVDLVAAQIDGGDEVDDWRAAVRHRAIAAHDALLRHPWAAALWVRTTVGPARMAHMDALLRTLRRGGFPEDLLDLAFHTLENHVTGHAMQRVSFAMTPEEMADGAARFLAQLEVDAYPELAAHVRWHAEAPPGDDAFTFGLDLILDGLERARVDSPR